MTLDDEVEDINFDWAANANDNNASIENPQNLEDIDLSYLDYTNNSGKRKRGAARSRPNKVRCTDSNSSRGQQNKYNRFFIIYTLIVL